MCTHKSNFHASLGTIFFLIGFVNLLRWEFLDFGVWFFIALGMLLNAPKQRSAKLLAVGSIAAALILLVIRLAIDFSS